MRGVAKQNSKVFTAIDIGTTKVFTVIGRKTNAGQIEALGYGVASCSGVHKGVVDDVAATQTAIRNSVSMAERSSGTKVDAAFVGVSGRNISYEKCFNAMDWVGEHGVITANDVERVPNSVAGMRKNGGRQGQRLIHAVPHSYYIEGNVGVSDPMGMHTRELDVETHLIHGSEAEIAKLSDAVKGAGVEKIQSLVLEAVASSESVLTHEEKYVGAAVVDIGGGTTDVIVYKDGTMQYSSVIPVGGFQFTNDICVVFNTTFEAAEEVKVNHANALHDSATIHEEVSLPIAGGKTSMSASLHNICQLTRERAQELTNLIILKLREGGVYDLQGYRIVLTGGACNLRGFPELFQSTTSASVRLGKPLDYYGIPSELQKPMYSTGIGIIVWAMNQEDDEPKPHTIGEGNGRRFLQRPKVNGNSSNKVNGNGNVRRGGIISLFRR